MVEVFGSLTTFVTVVLTAIVVPTAAAFSFGEIRPIITSKHSSRLIRLSSTLGDSNEIHPAVAGWPEKYAGDSNNNGNAGPRILSPEFSVQKATPALLQELDVSNWPIWTTRQNEKWAEGNQVTDKVMPYGELSYLIAGKLEIIPAATKQPVYVNVGDLVTFPEGFQSDWKVIEELTWYYYLY
mmetsp:Transcript_13804/g.19897  ORF Transcript_13804/g.19897 Transcript_13804/m.19897 type:complete len:183 (+) Transcript_13804:164-712(+)|eukprot:CAMPEP_0202448884 /NCGR_PEP_ID=MMETSP1360-20130828/7680_1 /ASSEMBLY_ACC=CAM_ASM_000848 /TAXON_ID=515479 /ORGANISM="Licmophora paradoxa, Strain CCMP2313" /LENGTH=182 /DNA_ID=CAMNT_0049066641 /DNA_START=106 /DNA_END=654 /DNA_ORIENTATION=+